MICFIESGLKMTDDLCFLINGEESWFHPHEQATTKAKAKNLAKAHSKKNYIRVLQRESYYDKNTRKYLKRPRKFWYVFVSEKKKPAKK